MDVPGGAGKSPNTSLSFRYNANNEELEELFNISDEDPPTPHNDASPSIQCENASPRRTSSIIDKYFKSMKVDKTDKEKLEELKSESPKTSEEVKNVMSKDVTSSPVKDYLNRFSKRTTASETTVGPEVPNETWKIFHDFKYKIAQAVEDMKTRSSEETKEKSVPRDNSTSDSEENSVIKDIDLSVGDTDNQVSSLDSSIQNLSEITQPITAKANDCDSSPRVRTNSESTDDTHKNMEPNDSLDIPKVLLDDINMEVESGIEALEDSVDIGGIGHPTDLNEDISPNEHSPSIINFAMIPPPKLKTEKQEKQTYIMHFTMYLITIVLLLSYTILPEWNVWNGFLLGIWVYYFCSNLKRWVLDNYFGEEATSRGFRRAKRSKPATAAYTIPSVKEHKPLKKFDGWINHYRSPDYDPYTYHINKTTTAFMKLEGCNLRLSYTQAKVAKRALWDEKIENVSFYQHRLYNLTGARVILLPKGLVRKRQWSKKYPICVVLNESEKIQVLEKEVPERRPSDSQASEKRGRDPALTEVESTETNTSSPEKKKKFVWRRREKCVSHADSDAGREGLRHRLVRKMHRDKKTDSVATSTDATTESQQTDAPPPPPPPTDDAAFFDAEAELRGAGAGAAAAAAAAGGREEDDEFDESELMRINEFLDEAESEAGVETTGDGEWSVHVRASQGSHSHVYLFARTGRDKHEWFRRLSLSISEANASAESSAADERAAAAASEPPPDRDVVNMALYRVAEKEVSFSKPPKTLDSTSSEQLAEPTAHLPPDMEAYEKSFWPYLFKIIQSKSPSGCTCRLLPPEVTWVNTVVARLLYDAMRDPRLVHAAQNRIQRKLNTLKLPSFMSPLIVTELSLAGACPLVENVSAPAWDERGVWLDADLRYDGGAYITILTQINLMKLKEKNVTLEDHLMVNENAAENDVKGNFSGHLFPSDTHHRQKKPAIFDSDCEDSAESSSDDESPPVQPVDSVENILPDSPTMSATDTNQGSSKKKFLRMVDKIAMNKYFQQVTDYKYVKRAMEGLSNTDIKLQLEVHGLEGRLALNLPPPPHDRLWIGFRTNPHLELKARPAFGARTLRFAHISNWIEQKLSKEFEKFLVLPNMEDFTIDLMTPTPVNFE